MAKRQVLLNQPRYDFAWQREYHFDNLLEVPKGSLLIADYVYDNSDANGVNPDPKKHVTFGEQTSEEMLFTFARFRFKGETHQRNATTSGSRSCRATSCSARSTTTSTAS